MERFLIFFSKGPGFSPCIASVATVGGAAFPLNSRTFGVESELIAALQQAGVPDHVSDFARTAVRSGFNSWIEVDEQKARLFASGHYDET